MQWFYDLRTTKKMLVFITVMTIGMVTIGFTGYYFNQQANNYLKIMYSDNLLPVEYINKASVAFNANRADIFGIILEKIRISRSR